MIDFNSFTVVGRIGSDVRTFGEGDKSGCSFSVASTASSKKGDDGKWVDETDWFNVSVWGKQSEFVVKNIGKGAKALIQGRLSQRKYEKDGQTRTSLEVKAVSVNLLSPAKEKAAGDTPSW